MRQLLPAPLEDVDPAHVYRRDDPAAPGGRPWVVANMISSADGSAAVDGRSGPLGCPADKLVFRLLRRSADVILAGAETVRAEGYRPVDGPPAVPIAVISRSLDLDPSVPLFAGRARTVVLTGGASDPVRRARLAEVADVVVCGDASTSSVGVGDAVRELGLLGHRRILCEGGPSLLAQLVEDDLVDELCVTVAPVLAGGDGPRILTGGRWPEPRRRHLASLLEEDGALFARYVRG